MAAGGGAWKVAYADFVTAMMAFFMVMWLTAQNDDVKKAIGGYFQDPWGTSAENTSPSMMSPAGITGDAPFADAASGVLPQRQLQANQENATDKEAGAASVWQQRQKIQLVVNTDRNLPALVVNFDEASGTLPALAQQRLKDLLPVLIGKQNKIELRAHSTRRPLPKDSAFRDHWQLCFERALSTMRFLKENGVEADRIRLSQTAAYEPLTTRLETAWQNENNCVEVFVLTEIVERSAGLKRPARKPLATETQGADKPAEAAAATAVPGTEQASTAL